MAKGGRAAGSGDGCWSTVWIFIFLAHSCLISFYFWVLCWKWEDGMVWYLRRDVYKRLGWLS